MNLSLRNFINNYIPTNSRIMIIKDGTVIFDDEVGAVYSLGNYYLNFSVVDTVTVINGKLCLKCG